MNDAAWIPLHRYKLADILKNKCLGELKIGTSEYQIEPLLGPAERPPARLNKKSKIWIWQYGNVTLTIAQKIVIQIQIDFEGKRTQMILLDALENWKRTDWEEFAFQSNWKILSETTRLLLTSQDIKLFLNKDGCLHLVSIG